MQDVNGLENGLTPSPECLFNPANWQQLASANKLPSERGIALDESVMLFSRGKLWRVNPTSARDMK
jgi:hypothetical protein